MMGNRRPFANLTGDAWQNLAIAAIILVYVAQVVLDIAWGNLFGNLGVDFAAFWTAGRIANHEGYAAAYDLQAVAAVQRQLLPPGAQLAAAERVLPAAYLPLFLVPFQVLALLPPAPAAAIWIGLNLLATLLYLRHFAASTIERRVRDPLIILLMISVPVFQNAFLGQANLWLMICVGEFIRSQRAGRQFHSGLWLAGLLLKPQCLLLIVPAVLLQRQWRAAAGTLLAGAAVIISTWLLGGTAAFAALSRLWLGYAAGLPGNDPQLMMNWRMIGTHVQSLIGIPWAQGIVLAGTVVTVIAALASSLHPSDPTDTRTTVRFLAVFAATTLVAWHSHVHMAVILVPALLVLAASAESPFLQCLKWWVWLPAAIHVVRILLAALARADIVPENSFGLIDLLGGLGLFLVTAALVGVTARWLAEPGHAGVRETPRA